MLREATQGRDAKKPPFVRRASVGLLMDYLFIRQSSPVWSGLLAGPLLLWEVLELTLHTSFPQQWMFCMG